MLCGPEAPQDRDYILMPFNAITLPIMPRSRSVLLQTCHLVWSLGLSEAAFAAVSVAVGQEFLISSVSFFFP